MASIHTRPATLDDLPSINTIHYEALSIYHDFYAAFFAMHPQKLLARLNARALRNPGQIFRVAYQNSADADGQEEVVGFVRYQVVNEKGETEGDDTTGLEPIGPLVQSKEHVKELWARFSERDDAMDKVYESASAGTRHFFVKHLMVHPSHQRKGIGGKLLAEVTARADTEDVPTIMVSSAEGYGLYGKLGFEDLETFRIDNEYWAGEVVKLEKELGILEREGNDGLAEKYRGIEEVENYMIRRPRKA